MKIVAVSMLCDESSKKLKVVLKVLSSLKRPCVKVDMPLGRRRRGEEQVEDMVLQTPTRL